MGRQKTYDREEVVERAMGVFWKAGYHGSSTRDLANAMGVNPYSLYAEFGSKDALYEAAVDRYEKLVVTRHFGALETQSSSIKEIRAVLLFFGESAEYQQSDLGCFLCNAAVELAPSIERSRGIAERYVGRLTEAFANALRNADANGRLVEDAPIDALASFLTTLLLGIFVQMRAKIGGFALRSSAAQGLALLDQFIAD